MDTLDLLGFLTIFISGNNSSSNEKPSSICIEIWSLLPKLANNFASIARASFVYKTWSSMLS